jgi:hypothetical protein
MSAHVRCEFASGKCSKKWLSVWLVGILVTFSCAATLLYPFLKSIGVLPTDIIAYSDIRLTGESYLIIIVWVLTLIVCAIRPHEDPFFCIVDSVGMTWLVVYILKSTGNI